MSIGRDPRGRDRLIVVDELLHPARGIYPIAGAGANRVSLFEEALGGLDFERR
jgi:hypothetical protein